MATLQELCQRLETVAAVMGDGGEVVYRDAANAMGAALLRTVRLKTHRQTNQLVNAWRVTRAAPNAGGGYRVEVSNAAPYASYVEQGHRGISYPTKYGWRVLHTNTRFTPGQWMLKKSAELVEQNCEPILERSMQKSLAKILGGLR